MPRCGGHVTKQGSRPLWWALIEAIQHAPAGFPARDAKDAIIARRGRQARSTSLFAALNTATGHVTDACHPRHRHQEFLKFLKKVAAAYLVECFFSVITRQAIRRGSFTSVKELTMAIGTFIDTWNDSPSPVRLDQGRGGEPRQHQARED